MAESYTVVSENDPAALTALVSHRLVAGWRLRGDLIVTACPMAWEDMHGPEPVRLHTVRYLYTQVLVKPAESSGDWENICWHQGESPLVRTYALWPDETGTVQCSLYTADYPMHPLLPLDAYLVAVNMTQSMSDADAEREAYVAYAASRERASHDPH